MKNWPFLSWLGSFPCSARWSMWGFAACSACCTWRSQVLHNEPLHKRRPGSGENHCSSSRLGHFRDVCSVWANKIRWNTAAHCFLETVGWIPFNCWHISGLVTVGLPKEPAAGGEDVAERLRKWDAHRSHRERPEGQKAPWNADQKQLHFPWPKPIVIRHKHRGLDSFRLLRWVSAAAGHGWRPGYLLGLYVLGSTAAATAGDLFASKLAGTLAESGGCERAIRLKWSPVLGSSWCLRNLKLEFVSQNPLVGLG